MAEINLVQKDRIEKDNAHQISECANKRKMKKRRICNLVAVGVMTGLLAIMVAGCGNGNGDKTAEESRRQTMQEPVTASTESSTEVAPNAKQDGVDDFTTPQDFLAPQGERTYGETQTVTYYSATTRSERQANVILPVTYNSDTKYPVLYLLHGLGCNHESWGDLGAKYIVQNLHYDQDLSEMIIVCPDGLTVANGTESDMEISEVVTAYDLSIDDMMNDLMPFVNANYSTATCRENTAIAGFSMGGREALYIGFTYPQEFGYVGGFSPAPGVVADSPESLLPSLLNDFTLPLDIGQFYELYLEVGDEDSGCGPATENYDRILDEQGINHIYHVIPGGHEGSVWQDSLYNFAKRLFQ